MEQKVKRMIIEQEDLEGKINRLAKLIGDPDKNSAFNKSSKEEQELCKEQLEHMKSYLKCLKARIEIHS